MTLKEFAVLKRDDVTFCSAATIVATSDNCKIVYQVGKSQTAALLQLLNFLCLYLVCVCVHLYLGELGDCDPLEHSPELVSEFRFTPKQSETMEADIFSRWLDLR